MSVDKLVDSTQLDADLASVANAIRTKGGTSAQLAFPQGFVDAVEAIETGGGGEWTTNGIANKSEPNGAIKISASSVGYNGFYQFTGITSVVVESSCSLGTNAFYDCSAMTLFVSQVGTTFSGSSTISRNTNLKTIDIKTNTINKSLALSQNAKLTSLILRRSDAITTVTQTNAFNGSISTSKPLHVYVPSALKATYEAATNWSTWVGNGTIIFEALEGSQYEDPDWWKS